ncbi:jg17181, partial [Pararge aegeria aegeria]
MWRPSAPCSSAWLLLALGLTAAYTDTEDFLSDLDKP